jgi:hypothetical protein
MFTFLLVRKIQHDVKKKLLQQHLIVTVVTLLLVLKTGEIDILLRPIYYKKTIDGKRCYGSVF